MDPKTVTVAETVQQFTREARRVTELATLHWLLDEATVDLGFAHFALMLRLPGVACDDDQLLLSSFPQGWRRLLRDAMVGPANPVAAACEQADAGFAWTAIPGLVRLSSQQRQALIEAGRQGIATALTVPLPKRGATMAHCTFASSERFEIGAIAAAAAQAVAWFAFDAARRITPSASMARDQPLTSRQRDCLKLYARGKSDRDIAVLLGISHRTVGEYIETAKRRFDVATRQQLLTHALQSGQLLFEEVV